jgi:hypothetical protein
MGDLLRSRPHFLNESGQHVGELVVGHEARAFDSDAVVVEVQFAAVVC